MARQVQSARRDFLVFAAKGAVVVAVAPLVSACGEYVTNNYYGAQDGGTASAKDAGPCDNVSIAQKCEKSGSAASCVLNKGRSIELNGVIFTYTGAENKNGLYVYNFDVADSDLNCKEIKKVEINMVKNPNGTYSAKDLVSIYGKGFMITVDGLASVDNQHAQNPDEQAALVRIEAVRGIVPDDCAKTVLGGGELHQGDELTVGSMPYQIKVRLLDITTSQKAILGFYDIKGTQLLPVMKFNNGYTIVQDPLNFNQTIMIEARNIALGGTFGFKGATINVTSCYAAL